MGAGQELGQVVAGDVLDHPAAGLEQLAAAGYGADAEHMVAHRARLDPARPGQVAGDHAAQAGAGRRLAEQGAEIGGLEGELLLVLGELRLDLGERRAGLGRQHQLGRLVERDAGMADEAEILRRLDRPPERLLAAGADQRQRRLRRHRLGHRRRQLGLVAWLEPAHAVRPDCRTRFSLQVSPKHSAVGKRTGWRDGAQSRWRSTA